MILRTPRDLGAYLRDRRRSLKLDQATVAARVGVSRQWLIDVEHGKPRAELGLVLKALAALGVHLTAVDANETPTNVEDLDAILARTSDSDRQRPRVPGKKPKTAPRGERTSPAPKRARASRA